MNNDKKMFKTDRLVDEAAARIRAKRHLNVVTTSDARPKKGATNGAGTAATEAPEPPRPLMREIPPADPFPTDALGKLLANAAHGIQDRTRAPIAMCAQSVLAAATLATQGHANVRLPTGQVRPISSYFVTVGVSGERKSAVDAQATWPMTKYEATLRDQYGPQKLDYENEKEAWDKARDHAKTAGKGVKAAIKSALDELGPPPAEPPLPRLTCSEPTIEGLVNCLQGVGRALVFSLTKAGCLSAATA